ncbi:MAG: hypothetical protein A3J79_09620 [Elusimicrobia bacterium RIFOXYB2_FULL_62_6]|nr:MAG: hypothetical protein A3J79_09620 [Elusimicrobia bacterium RIFOXYB2_FULL_62_6]
MADDAKKILVADDDPGTREFYRLCLEDAGFLVETVEDTAAAVVKCLEFEPDLVMLDADMPGGGGMKAVEQLRDILVKGVPALFVTGMPEAVDVFACKHNIRVLKKPASTAVLLRTINLLLEKAGLEKE